MKEFVLTQPYNSLDEMLNSGEVAVYKEELEQGNIEKYAIVSRIGNRYDLSGNKIEDFVCNPFFKKDVQFDVEHLTREDVIEEANTTIEELLVVEEKNMEEEEMKYPEIEQIIDKVVAEQVDGVKAIYEEKIAELKKENEQNIVIAKAEAKAELIAKLKD